MALFLKAFAGLVFLLAVLAAALFVPAGTLDYWQAWAFLGVFAGSVTIITLDLAKRDPALLARRVQAGPVAEKKANQKVIQALASPAFLAVFVVSALDRRYGWSDVPLVVAVCGDLLVLGGLFVVFLVFRENTFTSATIEVAREQRVVSTGPYAVVRHPMYSGALVMMLGVPLALASFWGLLLLPPLGAIIVWRLLDEEKELEKSLVGYREYLAVVKRRLVPHAW